MENALKQAEQLTSLTVASPDQITTIERFAFANCPTLMQINGETQVADAKALFTEIGSWSQNVFYRTGLTGIEVTGTENAVTDNGSDMSGNVIIDGKKYEFTLHVAPSAKEQPAIREGRLVYYTGEVPKVTATFFGEQTTAGTQTSPKFRVYFQPSAAGLTFERNVGSSFRVANWSNDIYLKKVPGSNLFYYETEFHTGQTLEFSMLPSFANRVTNGGDLNVWAEIVPGNQDALQNVPGSDSSYVPMSFETKRVEYVTKKEPAKVEGRKYISTPYGSALQFGEANSNFSELFYVAFSNEQERGVTGNYGEDPLKDVSLNDQMTLPDGFIWNPKMVEEINAGRVTYKKSGYYLTAAVNIDGEVFEFLSVELDSTLSESFQIPFFRLSADGKTLKFGWNMNLMQSRSYDTQYLLDNLIKYVFRISLSTGSILVDSDKIGKTISPSGTFYFENTIETTYSYFYSEPYSKSANASLPIDLSDRGLIFAKWADQDIRYWGEDFSYDIAVYNASVITKSEVKKIDDSLNSYLYIKAENMESMFKNTEIGSGLSIVMQHAALNVPITQRDGVKDVFGNPVNPKLYSENTGSNGIPYDSIETEDSGQIAADYVITITKDSDLYQLTYRRESEQNAVTISGNSIASLLQQINYVTRAETETSIHIDLSQPMEVAPLEVKEIKIPVTFKDTFMLLGRDMPGRHNSAFESLNVNKATAVWNNGGADQTTIITESRKYPEDLILRIESSVYKYPLQVNREFYFGKGAYVNGIYQSDPQKIAAKSGDLITYALYFRHYGSGKRDILPLVDKMQGTQMLIAEKSQNPSLESKQLSSYRNNDVDYYVLNKPGVYRDVKLGSMHADWIEIKQLPDGNLETYIKWYLQDVQGDIYQFIQYNAVIPTADMMEENHIPPISFVNSAWLNDHQTHRLTAGTSGTILEHHKKIVDQRGGVTPEHDVLNPKDFSYIKDGSQVTYRLELRNTNNFPLRLNASEIYDMLPITGTDQAAFSWEKNVNISMEMKKSSDEIKVNQFDSWDITSVRPSDQTSRIGQQFIWWNPNATDPFYIQYPSEGTVWIYVTLKFPSTSIEGEAEKWDAYENMAAVARLENTLYVYNTPESVYHNLALPGKVFLQKGSVGTIYDDSINGDNVISYVNLYNGNWNKDGKKIFSPGKLANKFYVMLYNPGKTKLYLDELQDVLPEGFRIKGLLFGNSFYQSKPGEEVAEQNMSSNSWYRSSMELNLSTLYISSENAKANAELNTEQAIHWKSATVSYSTALQNTESDIQEEQKTQKVTFRLSNDHGGDLAYDVDQQRYYLEPGDAFAFTYRVETPQYSYGPDFATNRIAMKCYDPAGMGVQVDENLQSVSHRYCYYASGVKKGDILPDSAIPNEGDTEVISGAKAKELTFTDEEENVSWIASDVTLQKGVLAPDIHKEIISETRDDGTTVAYPGYAATTSIIGWKTTVYNNGTAEMRNYKLLDTMNESYEFFGAVKLTVHKLNGYEYEKQLFEITGRTGDSLKVKLNTVEEPTVYMNAQNPTLLSYGRFIVDFKNYKTDSTNMVRFTNEVVPNKTDKRETMELIFTDNDRMSIENGWLKPGEYMELTYFTRPRAGITEKNYVYNNTSMVTPTSPTDYSTAKIVKGSNVTDAYGNNLGVRSTDFVTTSIGYATQSNKYVREGSLSTMSPINETHAFADKPFIEVKNRFVDYTLTVKTPESNALQDLVLIDNLPEVGDTYPMGEGEKRDSEMRMEIWNDFSDNLQVQVENADGTITSLQNNTDYTVEFCEEGTGFTDDDWQGTNSGKWLTKDQLFAKYDGLQISRSEAWKKQRAIRFILKEPNPGTPSAPIMPANATVKIKFRAHIYNPESRTEHAELPVQDSKKAWNSFGYSYKINAGSEVPRLYAASPRVGVMIKNEPHILKRYLDSRGYLESVHAKYDGEGVTFLIYEGDSIGNLHHLTGPEIVSRLQEEGRKFAVVTISPNAVQPLPMYEGYFEEATNSFVSFDRYSGSGHEWNWENGKHYTVFEQYPSLNMPGRYRPFRIFDNQNRDWASSFPKDGESYSYNYDLTFAYDPGEPIDIVADNISDFYDFRLVKQDAYKGTPVQNNRALFAIYEEVKETDNPESTYYINTHISEEEFMQYIAEYNQPKAWDQSARTVNGSAEEFDRIVEFTDAHGTVWRLVDVLGSGQDGTVKSAEVSGEENHQRHHKTMMDASRRMFVRELDAPIGYVKMDTDQEIIHPNEVVAPSEDGTIHYYDTVVANVPTVELPKTGGGGRSPFVRLGLALLGLSALTMYLYRKKRKI